MFLDAFLPQSLADLGDNPERAQRTVEAGSNEIAFDEAVSGLLGGTDAASTASESSGDDFADVPSDDERGALDVGALADDARGRLPADAGDRARAKEMKKAAAKEAKAQAAERRKTKVKKHVKKKATKHNRK